MVETPPERCVHPLLPNPAGANGGGRWPHCGGFDIQAGSVWRDLARCYLMFAEESWTSDRVRSLIDRWSIRMRPT